MGGEDETGETAWDTSDMPETGDERLIVEDAMTGDEAGVGNECFEPMMGWNWCESLGSPHKQ